jgi:hypothetical protein
MRYKKQEDTKRKFSSLFNGDQNKLWRSDSKQQNIKYKKKQEDTRRKFVSLFNGDQKKNYLIFAVYICYC